LFGKKIGMAFILVYDGKLVPWGDANVNVLTKWASLWQSCVLVRRARGRRLWAASIFLFFKATAHRAAS